VREILALEVDAATDPLRQPPGEVERRRPSDEIAQERVEFGPEALVAAGLGPRRGQLVEGGDQDLGHEPTPVGPEALVDGRRGPGCGHATTGASVPAARVRSANAAISVWSFIPGADSTPLATSTANG